MKIIKAVKEMGEISGDLRSKGEKIGFVPTMGYLHEGHLSLVGAAKKESSTVVMSIYVNPTQFGHGEDFDRYPRDLSHDKEMAQERGVNFIFAPTDREMYSEEHGTFVEVEKVAHILEGEFRPGHFRGVATVVAKLLNIVRPDIAVFGQKDAQQAFIVKKMALELNFATKILVSPIVRERDGLALSSRNVYLSPLQRKEATVLYRSLKLAEAMVADGEKDLARIHEMMVKMINAESEGRIDYIAFVNPDTFETVKEIRSIKEILALLAVRFGQTRLIDNLSLKVKNKK